MSVILSLFAGVGQQFFDNDGNVLAGGKIYTYLAGTNTPQATYTDPAGAIAHPNPIILDSAGRVATGEVWVTAGVSYKFIVQTSTGTQIGSYDNVFTASGSAATTSYTAPYPNAVSRSVQSKLAESVSVKDFGAVGDGLSDDTAAIQAAVNSLSAAGKGGTLFLPAGTYKITSNINITWPNSTDANSPSRITVKGEGADLSYIYDYRSNTAAASGGAITVDFSIGTANKYLTMYFGEFSIIKKVNATTYNAGTYTIGTGVGLYLDTVPGIGALNDIRVIGYNTGVSLKDCLGITINNFNVQLADIGFLAGFVAFSEPTAMQFNNCTVAGVKTLGYAISGGGPIAINGGVIETVGVMSGGSQPVTGGIFYNASGFLPTQLVVDGVFFENNGGSADIYINVASGVTAKSSSSIQNCMFARNSNTLYTTNNIFVSNNNSSSTLTVTTISNGFKGYSPYTPNPSRKYIDASGVGATTIYGLGNTYDSATEVPTVVTNIAGGGGGSQNLQSVTTLGSTTTVNCFFNGANIGTFTGVPSVTSNGSTVGMANSTNGIVLDGASWRGTGNNTNNLGAVSYLYNNVYATTYNIGAGTANITASGNNVVLNGVAAAVPGNGFAPSVTNTYYLGGSSLTWKGLYIGDGNVDWNGYAIPAPAGSTTTFLRNDGTWATPSGSGIGTVTNVGSGNGLTGGPITSTGTLSINFAYSGTYTANQNFNGANIGTFSSIPSVTSLGTTVGLANSTNGVVLNVSAWQGAGDFTNDLGGVSNRWNNLYLKNTFAWNGYSIPAPAGSTTTFLRNDGTWATPSGSGIGTVTNVGSGNGLTGGPITSTGTLSINFAYSGTYTANQNFNGANIGTFSSIPSVTSTGTTVGLANSTNGVVLNVAAWQGAGDFTNDLGGVSNRWNNLYLKNTFAWNGYNIAAPTGSAVTFLRNDGTWATPAGGGTVTSITAGTGLTGGTITTSGTVALDLTRANTWSGKQTFNGEFATNSVGTVSGVGIAPITTNAYFCGGSSLRWANMYSTLLDVSSSFTWGGYGISAPSGSTSTFLRNDGIWATPTSSSVPNSVTFNNGGSGGGSGSTFNGSSPLTVSYNTIGAPSTSGAGASGTWGINITGTAQGLSGSPSIVVSSVTAGSATNALGSSGLNTTLGNGTVFVAPAAGFAPSVDNSYVLGSPSFRWSTVYAGNGTINTSDARQKQQDRPLSEAEKAVAIRIKHLIKTFKFNKAVEEKGDGARIHVGVYAQELADAFAAEGLDAHQYGMFCYDEIEGGDIFGVRYEELLAFVIAAM